MINTNGTAGFFKRFTKIKGKYPISSIRRLTWKGKIHLGVQVPTIERDEKGHYKLDQNGNPIQKRDKFGELEFHPKDVHYFVCPSEVEALFGKNPTELDIAFPLSGLDENGLPDIGGLFPQAYKYYGSSRGLKCVGDGETAMKANEEGVFEEVECPCDKFGQKDGCSKRASLFFFIPSISMGGIYVIGSGSWNSMVDIQSGIYLALELLKDPITGEYNSITMLPFKLRRIERETQHEKRKDKHWPLTCELDLPIEDIKKIRMGKTLFLEQKRVYQIPERPEEINPKFDSEKEGAVFKRFTEEEIKEIEKKEAIAQEELKKENEAKEKKEKEARDQEKQKETKEPVKEKAKFKIIGTIPEEEKEPIPIKEKAKEQDLKKEIEESRDREANLKKEHEEGKDKIKSYQESKILSKKRVEEENKILNEICLKAQKAGVDSFEKLINFALDRGIFQTPLAEHLAKKILISNKDIYDRLMRALEPLKEEDKEKLDKMFSVLNKAGISTWKTVAWFACKADLIEPGTSIEDVQKILLNDPEAIEKIIDISKMED
jgi:hypothetical protein